MALHILTPPVHQWVQRFEAKQVLNKLRISITQTFKKKPSRHFRNLLRCNFFLACLKWYILTGEVTERTDQMFCFVTSVRGGQFLFFFFLIFFYISTFFCHILWWWTVCWQFSDCWSRHWSRHRRLLLFPQTNSNLNPVTIRVISNV